ncbi:hypothetical protein ANN_21300 [Periplaneta americana]|uniref:Reverse transcriptase domain-containing protein n=1 Tax=Periplaneta americana TaxID=6978 RepID=A0ABQ8SG56_PERAM|nr:hypothetical protein ANN_21300 [Periplaneta americana]
MSNSATDTNSTKRQKLHHETTIPTSNAFAPLADLNERDQQESSYHIQMETSTPKKPPPIYIHNILNINSMLNELKTLDCGANYRGCPEHTRLQRGATRHQTIPYRSQPAPGTSSLDKTSASPPELKKVPTGLSIFRCTQEFSNRPLYSSIAASSVNKQDYQIGSFYSAPDQRVTPTLIWGIVHEMKFRFILGGDFNSKHPGWGSNVTNPRGIMLYDQIFKLNLEIAYPFEPTHYPDSGHMPDLLDFFIGKQFQHFCNVPRVIHELSSDHLPVLLTLSAAIPNSCVPQGSILAPFLYLIYTHDIPTPKSDSLTVAQFADDIAVLSKGDTGEQVTTILQNFLQEIEILNKKWRTVMNTNKSSTVTFTYLKRKSTSIIPQLFTSTTA